MVEGPYIDRRIICAQGLLLSFLKHVGTALLEEDFAFSRVIKEIKITFRGIVSLWR